MGRRTEHAARDLHHRLVRDRLEATTRRAFLGRIGTGIGGMALAWATAEATRPAFGMGDGETTVGLDLTRPHFAPKAKRIVYLYMAGSPPHHDLLDLGNGLVFHL